MYTGWINPKKNATMFRSVCMKCLIGLLPVFRSGQRQGIAVQHLVWQYGCQITWRCGPYRTDCRQPAQQCYQVYGMRRNLLSCRLFSREIVFGSDWLRHWHDGGNTCTYFRPFERQMTANNTDGFGLGLSIIQGLVHLFNGEIDVKARFIKEVPSR